MSLLRRLLPSEDEIDRLAVRETDPRHQDEFSPLTSGPVSTVIQLIAIGVAAAVVTPFRLFLRRR